MAIGGGVLRSPSTSASAVEPRRRAPSTVRRGAALRCGTAGRWAGRGLLLDAEADAGGHQGRRQEGLPRLALQYHPDVRRHESDDGSGTDFQRINVAYQVVMSNMREAEERLEYWRLRYGLADEDLDRYRHYLNDDDDDWFDL